MQRMPLSAETAVDPIVLRAWPKALHIERGGTARLDELVARLGTRALVVCGTTVAGGPILARVRAGLGDRLAGVFDRVRAHTPLAAVHAGARALAECKADVIVSVGGGSATDAAKAIAIAALGNGLDPYRSDGAVVRSGPRTQLPESIVPHIAVPTVPGAGNVMLPTAGVLDPQTRAKFLFDDPALVPKIAVLDAELVAYCNAELTAITGMRSIVGAVEALYAKGRNPFTSCLALEAIRLMREALPASLAEPDNLEARERSLFAAVMGTLATMNAGVSVVHAAGLVIGGRYGIAHGVPHAVLLPHVMRAFGDALEPVRERLDAALAASGDEDTAAAFERLSASSGLPVRLRAIGVPQEDLPDIATQTAALAIMALAPRPVTTRELGVWLESAW
jgi:alcohol dehydrogenase class IV